MSYWDNIIIPKLKEITINTLQSFQAEELEITIWAGDLEFEPGKDKLTDITEIIMETSRTWINICCLDGKVMKVTEENDRGEVKVVHSDVLKFNKDEDVFVSEEYGYRTWMWTPSSGVKNAESLLKSFLDKAPEYFLIADPRAVDPDGKWFPLDMEFGKEDDCQGWWETYSGIRVEDVPDSNTGEYFLHIHERDDTYFTVRNPLTEKDIEERRKMVESFFGIKS